MKSNSIFCIAVLLFDAAIVPAAESESLPDDLSLADILSTTYVEAATRVEQRVSEAPSSINIITAAEIEMFGYRTLGEALAGLKGVYVTYDRLYLQLGVRGFARPGDYSTRILLLVDGVPVNDNLYSQSFFDRNMNIDMEMVDRIEFIRGPSSSVYGTNAFFGIVNVIGRNGASLDGSHISCVLGSPASGGMQGSLGASISGKVDIFASGSYFGSNGGTLYFPELDDGSKGSGEVSGLDHERVCKAQTGLTFGDFAVEHYFVDRIKGIPTGAWGIVYDNADNWYHDRSANTMLKYGRRLSDAFKVNAEIHHLYCRFTGRYWYDNADEGEPPDLYADEDLAVGQYIGGDARLTWSPHEAITVVAGAEGRINFQIDQFYYTVTDRDNPYLDERHKQEQAAGYAQVELKRKFEFPALYSANLSVGVRGDYYEALGKTINPRFAAVYAPFEITTLKVLYGTAFRAPNSFELFYDDNEMTYKANPDLKPETISTFELVLEQQIGRQVRASVSGYRYDIKDLITQGENDGGVMEFNNVEQIHARGVEGEMEALLPFGIMALGSYSLQEASEHNDDQVSEGQITNSPCHMAKLRISVPLLKYKIFLSPEYRYFGARKGIYGNWTKGAHECNATLSVKNVFDNRFLSGLQTTLSVYNLFNQHYKHPASSEHPMEFIEQDGLTVQLELAWGLKPGSR